MSEKIYIGVIGAGQCSSEHYETAFTAGRLIAESGAVVVCGGLGGVMEAVSKGADMAGGTVIGILPGIDRKDANPHLTISIPTGSGDMRNALVVRSSDGILAIGGKYGTLSEISYSLIWHKPVACLNSWDLTEPDGARTPLRHFNEPATAIEWLMKQIRN